MNILVACHSFQHLGGLEKVALLLTNSLASRGHKVTIITYFAPINRQDYSFLDIDKLKIKTFPNSKHKIARENKEYLHKLVISGKFEVLIYHNNSMILMHLCSEIGAICKIPVITVHHNEIVEKPSIATNSVKGLIKFLIWPIYMTHIRHIQVKRRYFEYNNSDKYVLLSPQYVEAFNQLIMHDTCSISKLTYIYNPLTISVNSPSNYQKYNEVLYVGRLCEGQKKVSRLLDIWKQIYEQHPDWTLRIIGDGADKANLMKKAQKIPSIIFEGFCSNVQPFYKRAAICCLVSDHEGLPLSLIEASQFGAIPMAFDSFRAVTDIVHPDLIIKSFNKKQFAEKLSLLMSNEALRNQYSKWSTTNVEKFSLTKITDDWENLLSSINYSENKMK
ncbi:glycosyltransferase [Paludibacter jiangxiensis]|uniref:Glycosyltransferase n=1 Tax=Paludibacter jiangxiensis TaxID=681398 RepID=A0A170Z3M8_9BACT|nr:glycosyltransferase [Paludibacter jiangxiensis]GAT62308.1 glycosyltransferase [Paludibacter jiangxiensis]